MKKFVLVRMRSPVRIWVAAPKIPENFGFWGFFVAKSCFVGWSKISDPHRDPHAEMKQIRYNKLRKLKIAEKVDTAFRALVE